MADDPTLEVFLNPDEVTVEDVVEDINLVERLMVHNDNVNTFDWVIQSLIEICQHSTVQAEQCAIFIHFKGSYAVKHGSRERLKPMKEGLVDRGINATLEH